MPSKKKKDGSSLKIKIFVIFIIFALVASYLTVFLNFNSNNATLPSASSFVSQSWMSFVPQGIQYFRLVNYSFISDLEYLLPSNVSLYLTDINYNLSIFDVQYEVDVQTNASDVILLKVNSTIASLISESLGNLNCTSLKFGNSTMYLINGSETNQPAWITVYHNAVLYSNNNETGPGGIAQIINASSKPFFDLDAYKIGALIASGLPNYFAFYFFNSADVTYQIDWAMITLSNPVKVSEMQVLHFPNSTIANANYNQVVKYYYNNSANVYIGENYIFGKIG